MSYYMGDYPGRRMRGYRGDPGFFSFLGGLAKTALGFIPGVGPIAQKLIPDIGAVSAPAIGRVSQIVSAGRGAMTTAGRAIVKHPALTAAGAAGAVGLAAGAHHVLARGQAPAMGGGGRRRRRMNACNPRALRRAIRRTHAFAKLAMKTIHIVHPKKKARFGGFKKKRSRK